MKYIVEAASLKQLDLFINNKSISDILLNIDGLSLGISLKISNKRINEILNKTDKISLKVDRLFHENEIEELSKTLKTINLEKVKFVFYSDLAVYDILKELKFEDKLVYDTHTYLTNTADVELYGKFNRYVVVSNQISVDEINNILKSINKNVIVHGFGKSIVFYSKRKLLTNYFNYRNFKYNPHSKDYYLQEEFRNERYHIVEDKNGSYIYEKGYYYLMKELNNLNKIDYILLHCSDLDEDIYLKVVEAYFEENEDKLNKIGIDLSKGIMENKSVLLKSEVTNQ